MRGNAELSGDGRTLAVRVPMTVAKRGGRKVIVAPRDAATPHSHNRVDNALVKALARAFRWQKLIENGVHATIAELAAAEKVNPSYVSGMLRLTLLAPDIVEAILDWSLPQNLTVGSVMRPIPVEWDQQRSQFFG